MTRSIPLTVADLRGRTTVSVAEAAAFLGMSTATGYRAVADGTLQTLGVGRARRVATPLLLRMVGLEYEVGLSDAVPPTRGDDSESQ